MTFDRGCRLLLLLCFWVLACPAFAQSNLVHVIHPTLQPLKHKNYGLLLPASLEIQSIQGQPLIKDQDYQLDDDHIRWSTNCPYDSVQVSFRVFSTPILDSIQLMNPALISKTPTAEKEALSLKELKLIEGENINYSGSISRGISIGNRQDLVLNSALDLQLAGTFAQGIEIEAAFSDQNIPLQPEGNTQQLRDFDKVFINLKKDNHSLRAGDYELNSDRSYFTKYLKKLQGATYFFDSDPYTDLGFSNTLSFAIARGRYARNNIIPIEGNQGPYKLFGNENEFFIIVIAATEKVYIDGILMKRGIEHDYTIDYNRAEIIFTAERLITKDRRIIIDFEYSNQDFVRSAYAYSAGFKNKNLETWLEVYSEQDNRNASAINNLDAEERQFLAGLGDDRSTQAFTGIRPLDEELNNPITYIMQDTLVDGIAYDSILVFSNDGDQNLFTARFSNVGFQNGNYIADPGFANGIHYEWVAPIDGIPQGDFEPIIQLNSPELNRMISGGVKTTLVDGLNLTSEVSLSTRDLNRFSDSDDDDNHGLGLMAELDYKKQINKRGLHFLASAKYELASEEFIFINPYRNAEFARDWNIEDQKFSDEHLGQFKLGLEANDRFRLIYGVHTFQRPEFFNGIRNQLDAYWSDNGYLLEINTSLLNSSSDVLESNYFRPNISFSKTFAKQWKVGALFFQEKNERIAIDQSLRDDSFQFQQLDLYVENADTAAFHNHFSLSRRSDLLPFQNELSLANSAWQFLYRGHLQKQENARLNWTLNYRKLDVEEAFAERQPARETYLGRLEFLFKPLKGFLNSVTTYEIGSGQEARSRFNYLEVEPGQGTFQWVDYNQDSIQQVNEFEVAINRDQARFIRFSLPTNDYIQTNNILFNQSLNLNPRILLQGSNKWHLWLSKFSTQSNFKINQKNMDQRPLWNPFEVQNEDENLISSSMLIRNVLFFQRANRKFNAFIGHSLTGNKINLDVGAQSTETNEYFLHYDIRLIEKLNHVFDLKRSRFTNRSDFFDLKNFVLEFTELEPQLKFLVNQQINAQISYNFLNSKNVLSIVGGERLKSEGLSASLNYQQKIDFSLNTSFTFKLVEFEGDQNSPVAFQMLDGLRRGRNFLWTLQLNKNLAKNLILSLNYEGRKTGQLALVHLGDIQVKASF